MEKPDSEKLSALRLDMERWQKIAQLFSSAKFSFTVMEAESAIEQVRKVQGDLLWVAGHVADSEALFQAQLKLEKPVEEDPKPEYVGPVAVADLEKPAEVH